LYNNENTKETTISLLLQKKRKNQRNNKVPNPEPLTPVRVGVNPNPILHTTSTPKQIDNPLLTIHPKGIYTVHPSTGASSILN